VSIVSNTSPLIALAKADALPLLKSLFGEVVIPPAVYHELLAKAGAEVHRLDDALNDFIHRLPMPTVTPEQEQATQHLGEGEQQAVLMAHHRGELLLVDDRQGRNSARTLNVPVTGTIGVLVKAKQAGLISAVLPILEQIRQNGYWLSDAMLETAARLAGETVA
jgi:predicted nucleic acid-binding protein